MATVKPFAGIRPNPAYAAQIAALPYDVMNRQEAKDMAKDNPYSFLHIDRAEIDLPDNIDPYSDIVYQTAKQKLNDMVKNGDFIQDTLPNYYIYRLTMDGRSQTGLVACTSIDEYLNGVIKKHELTRADKETDRIRHVDTLNANTGPIFLAYRKNDTAKTICNHWTDTISPVYDFVSDDGIQHTVWCIDDAKTINRLTESFAQVPYLYIADGHHRNASAVKVGQKRRAEHPNASDTAEFNYYLSVLFPADELHIFDYNRVVKDLHGYTETDFLKALETSFVVSPAPQSPFAPQKPHTFGMYLCGKWYCLEAKPTICNDDIVKGLDVSILQNTLLTPILGIQDPRTDKRIDFVGGIRGLHALQQRVDSGEMAVAFSMYPTSMQELMAVADAGLTMPPKSTWFEPKLRSGLFIHDLGK